MQRIPLKHKYHQFYTAGSLKAGRTVVDADKKEYVVLPSGALKRISDRVIGRRNNNSNRK